MVQTPKAPCSFYTFKEAAQVLKLDIALCRRLRESGLLPHTKVGKLFRLNKQYIDDLAAQLRIISKAPIKERLALVELFALKHAYDNPPALGQRRLTAYRALIYDQCERLVSEGTILRIETLVEKLSPFYKRRTVRDWAVRKRIMTMCVGSRRYLIRSYLKYIVWAISTCKTIAVIAEELKMDRNAIYRRLSRGKISAIKGPDGITRLSPESLASLRSVKTNSSHLVTMGKAATLIGTTPSTVRQWVRRGVVASVGFRSTRRIPLCEAQRWRDRFQTLNPGFEWLQAIIAIPGRKPTTLQATQVRRQLQIAEVTLIRWGKLNLLPYYVTSISAGPITQTWQYARQYVRLYIYGLLRYLSGSKATTAAAASYRTLCQQANNIV